MGVVGNMRSLTWFESARLVNMGFRVYKNMIVL